MLSRRVSIAVRCLSALESERINEIKKSAWEGSVLTNLSRKALANAFYFERYFLSFAYLFLAWRELRYLAPILVTGGGSATNFLNHEFIYLIKHTNLLLLQLFVGILLLTNRKPDRQPQTLREVVIPLIASFYTLVYSLLPSLPHAWQRNLFPIQVQVSFAVAGLVLGLIGPAIAIWGVMFLGRSFGIFVAVRDVVVRGPYRYVRHPMYLGHICALTGLVLVNLSAAIFLTVPIHMLLLLYRAKMEEFRLAEASVEYRNYIQRTGFIIPRLSRRAIAEAESPHEV